MIQKFVVKYRRNYETEYWSKNIFMQRDNEIDKLGNKL